MIAHVDVDGCHRRDRREINNPTEQATLHVPIPPRASAFGMPSSLEFRVNLNYTLNPIHTCISLYKYPYTTPEKAVVHL